MGIKPKHAIAAMLCAFIAVSAWACYDVTSSLCSVNDSVCEEWCEDNPSYCRYEKTIVRIASS